MHASIRRYQLQRGIGCLCSWKVCKGISSTSGSTISHLCSGRQIHHGLHTSKAKSQRNFVQVPVSSAGENRQGRYRKSSDATSIKTVS